MHSETPKKEKQEKKNWVLAQWQHTCLACLGPMSDSQHCGGGIGGEEWGGRGSGAVGGGREAEGGGGRGGGGGGASITVDEVLLRLVLKYIHGSFIVKMCTPNFHHLFQKSFFILNRNLKNGSIFCYRNVYFSTNAPSPVSNMASYLNICALFPTTSQWRPTWKSFILGCSSQKHHGDTNCFYFGLRSESRLQGCFQEELPRMNSPCHLQLSLLLHTVIWIWGRSGWPQRASPSNLTAQGSSELFNVRLCPSSKCLCLFLSCFASDIANHLLGCSWRLGCCAWYSFWHPSSDPLRGRRYWRRQRPSNVKCFVPILSEL